MKYLLYILIWIPIGLAAQVSTKVVLVNDTIRIGDVAKIQYEITSLKDPSNLQFVLANFDTLQNQILPIGEAENDGDFEIIQTGDWEIIRRKIDPKSLKWKRMNQAWILQNTVEVQCWMGGVYIIPPIEVMNLDSMQKLTKMPAYLNITIPEQTMLTDTTSQQTPLAIRDIMTEGRTIEDFIPFIIGLFSIILLGVGIWWYRKRQANKEATLVEVPKVIIPAHIIAFDKLEKLDKEQLWQDNNIKEYQTRLTYIIREYLENRYNIKALESTTDEIKRALKHQDFDMSYEVKLAEILQMADLIKFAKATPPADIHNRFMNDAKSFVNDTKQSINTEV